MISIRLERYKTGSVITLFEDKVHIAAIAYGDRVHAYRSDADFNSLNTELKTYGDKAMIELFEYLHGARSGNRKKRLGTSFIDASRGIARFSKQLRGDETS